MRAVRVVLGLVVVVSSFRSIHPAAAEPPEPAWRRLEAVHVGAVRGQHQTPFGIGTSLALALETGAFLTRDVGVTALVRGQMYDDELDGKTMRRRHDLFVGPRVYFQPIPGTLLAALGGGVIVQRVSDPAADPRVDYATQKFVEAYVGWTALSGRCTQLEVGSYGGYSPDEGYAWIALAISARRRAW